MYVIDRESHSWCLLVHGAYETSKRVKMSEKFIQPNIGRSVTNFGKLVYKM